jgi:hypothetical protein
MVGFMTEGTTGTRFLESVIQRTFDEIAFECTGEVDVLPVQHILVRSDTFSNEVLEASQKAEEMGLMVLCVHTDADDRSDTNAFEHKIAPAFTIVAATNIEACKNLVAIVPVQMTEAWMLADKSLLKEEIGTVHTNQKLGIYRQPEAFADPKEAIENAIRMAFQDLSQRRRRKFDISELYLPIGQKISLEKLEQLNSYRKFKQAVRDSYRALNYLH